MPINAHGQTIGEPVADWSARSVPAHASIAGRLCRLEPIDPVRHAEPLFAGLVETTADADWTYLPVERFHAFEPFKTYLAAQAASCDPLHFAIWVGEACVGTAALMRIDPANGVIEIGHICFGGRLRRTAAATEALFLFMRMVFDDLGYRRLEWKCDSLNAPSRGAAIRLGFEFEGVFRQAIVTKGRNRDTAWYAMTDGDWPAVRRALALWLAPENFDANNSQVRSLQSFRD